MATKKKTAKKKPVAKKKKAAPKRAKKAAPKPAHPAVVHWEIQAKDPVAAHKFFGELFGWKIDANNPMNYGMVAGAGKGTVAGGIGATMDTPRTTFYVQVPDINATLAKAQSLGAQTVLPRTDMGMVVMAQFKDHEGNVIGLVED